MCDVRNEGRSVDQLSELQSYDRERVYLTKIMRGPVLLAICPISHVHEQLSHPYPPHHSMHLLVCHPELAVSAVSVTSEPAL